MMESAVLNVNDKNYRHVLQLLRSEFDLSVLDDLKSIDDIERLANLLKKVKLHAQFVEAVNRCPSSNVMLPASSWLRWKRHQMRVNTMIEMIGFLKREFEFHHIEFLHIKGLGLSATAHDSIYTRESGDVDILVRPCDLNRVDNLLKNAGFVQPYTHRKITSKSAYEEVFESENTPFPLRTKSFSTQTIPYYTPWGRELFQIDLHDDLYTLPSSALEDMFHKATVSHLGSQAIPIPSLEHQIVLLLTNTYENSEDIFSNLSGDQLSFQDYCDIHMFVQRNLNHLDWDYAKQCIADYGIGEISAIVIQNYKEIYSDDALGELLGCARGIGVPGSPWGIGIIERILNSAFCRENAIPIIKNQLSRLNNTELPIRLVASSDAIPDDAFESCSSGCDKNIRYALSAEDNDLIIHWEIEEGLASSTEEEAFCLALYFCSLNIEFLQVTTTLRIEHGVPIAIAHSSNHLHQRPIFKPDALPLQCALTECIIYARQAVLVDVVIPNEVHRSCNILQEDVAVAANVFKRKYKTIYHLSGDGPYNLFHPRPLLHGEA